MSQSYKITDEIIRQTVSEKKTPLLEININYPQVKCPEYKVFEKRFNDFYATQMKQFNNYARTKLLAKAKRNYFASPESFSRWGAISNFRIRENPDKPDLVWVIQRVWIFRDEQKRGAQINQVWNLTDGSVKKAREDSIDFE